MVPWLQMVETWMVQQLLRTPGFHRLAERAARNVHRFRHGLPREEEGGTNIDDGRHDGGFLKHFTDEVKTQLGQAEKDEAQTALKTDARTQTAQKPSSREESEGAHETWENTRKNLGNDSGRKQGFMGEYMDALREQLNQDKQRR